MFFDVALYLYKYVFMFVYRGFCWVIKTIHVYELNELFELNNLFNCCATEPLGLNLAGNHCMLVA